MANATFKVATKAYHFEIDGKMYRKVTFEESKKFADAIQAAYNDGKSLGWFAPLNNAKSPPQGTA